ncbi:MAG: response regulator, partial [Acidimicrobiia bacterium]
DLNVDETAWDAHVLVVEDNDLNQEVVLHLLGQLGITADVASSGAEALAMVREFASGGTTYDLVLMDIQMPEMDGFEATRLLRQCPTHRQMPIIAMTAGVFASDRHDSSDAGMDDHLSKPIDPRQLARVLHRWLPVTTRRMATRRDSNVDAERVRGTEDSSERVLDVPTGLSYCSGLEAVFVSRLSRWLSDASPLAARLGAVRNQADAVGLRDDIHLLVSSAGYLGARDVSTLASRLESVLAADHTDPATSPSDVGQASPIATEAGLLADAITLVKSRVASLYPDALRNAQAVEENRPHSARDGHDDPIEAAATVADAIVARRDEMHELLRADDATASRYLDTHYRELASVFAVDHPSFDAFVAHVHRFDFAAALDTLERAVLERSDGSDHPAAPE